MKRFQLMGKIMTLIKKLEELANACEACAEKDDGSLDDHFENCPACKEHSETAEKLNQMADVIDYEIVPSYICVKQQLTYYDVNLMADKNGDILALRDIAGLLRRQRLARGAVQISLPPVIVKDLADFPDRLLEHAMSGWVGDHQRPEGVGVLLRLGAQIGDVHVTVLVAIDDHDLHSGHICAGGIRAVGR